MSLLRVALSLAVVFSILTQLTQGPVFAQNVGAVGQSAGIVALSRADGSAIQPAPAGTSLQIGDLIATTGTGTVVITLDGGAIIELGGMTTLQVVNSGPNGVELKLIEGAMVIRSSGPLPVPISISVEGRVFTIPGGVGRSGWSIGLSRSTDSQVILVCDRCPGDAGFNDEGETLDSGRMRTYDNRGDYFESKFTGSIFDALAEFPDDGSSNDKRPIGQRTASLPREKSNDVKASAATPTSTPILTSNQSVQVGSGSSSRSAGSTLTPSPTVTSTLTGGATAEPGTPSPTTTATRTATPTTTATSTLAPSVVEATIANFIYLPDPVRVPVGSSIRWTNFDFEDHTVTALDRSWTSPVMTKDGTFVKQFDQVGTIQYFCEPHPQMTSQIIVE